MTTLTITPNWKNKTARFKGTIAAGEHVAVRIVNDNGEGDEYIQAEDLANLRLRVVNPANGKTLAQFPMPEPEEEILPTVALEDEEETEGTEATEEDAETWGGLTPLSCTLNLNTDRMLMAVPPAANVPLLFVLDAYEGATDEDEGEFTLYFKDLCEVTHWPRRRGEEEPTRLDDYKDLIKDFRERIDAAEDSIRDAVDVANGIVAHVDAAKIVAQNSAATAKNWATGGGETGDPGATNNAKYFAQQAGASATSAETSATGAATAAANAEAWAVGKRNGVDVPSTDATYENNAKHYAAAAAASAQEAEETLENKADKATTLAGYGIADAYTKTETDGKISTAVSAEATARNTAISTAISAVKDSAPEAFDTLKEIADWIGDDQSGAAAMAAQISSHTSQLSQLSQDKVDKVAGKGLSTNDYTTAEKAKLGGVETGAKDNVVEAASASAFPQTGVTGKIYVAKDENKTYRWNGTQYVQIAGGSSVDVVPPSTDPSASGKAADAKATGDALAGKRDKDDLALYKKVGVGETWTLVGEGGITTEATGVFVAPDSWTFYRNGESIAGTGNEYTEDDYEVGWGGLEEIGNQGTATRPFAYQPVTGDSLAKTSQLPDVQLTPEYSQTPTFSEWALSPEPPISGTISIEWSDGRWSLFSDGASVAENIIPGAGQSAVYLEFQGDIFGLSTNIAATRTRTDVIGYTQGDQTTKPLQPKGDYAPATNIAKTALASGVQASLGKADTAVQPAALRYDLVQTITLGQLQDRAVQKVELNAATTTLVLPALTDLTGKVSDFGIDVINAYAPEVDGTPTPTAASFQLSGTLGTDYNLVVPKGETWSEMTALADGEMAAYYFTRSAFQIGDVPTWEVVKKVVEFVPVPTAP